MGREFVHHAMSLFLAAARRPPTRRQTLHEPAGSPRYDSVIHGEPLGFVAVQVRPPRTRLLHLPQQFAVSANNPYHTAATLSTNDKGSRSYLAAGQKGTKGQRTKAERVPSMAGAEEK